MPAAVTHVRSTYTDNDSINAAAFNVLTAVSATVADATAGSAGVMPSTTTAAGLSMIAAADATAQRALLSLSTMALQAAGAVAITGGTIAATPISGSTGAFTTVTASSTIAATGAVTGSNLTGTNTGDQTTITGNAGSATILQTARNINSVSFNGSADITVTAAAGTLTGATLASGVTASSLTSLGTIASLVATTADINGGTIDGTTVGATTPSTGAFTTVSATTPIAVASGGTGVSTSTGTTNVVLSNSPTLVTPNLGTPSAVVLTNASGTASININGTVGATTASTGAFTTLSASGTATVGPNNTGTGIALLQLLGGSGTNGGASVYFGTNGTMYSYIGQSSGIIGGTSTDFVIYANNSGQSIKFYAGGSGNVATITSTGLNSTAIGATTPSTGAFTTLAIGTNSGLGGTLGQFNGSNVVIANACGQFSIGTTNAAAADMGGSLGFTANTTSLAGYPMGNISARLIATGAGAYASYMAFATTDGSGTVAERMRLTSTGLAVTGQITATYNDIGGIIITGSAGSATSLKIVNSHYSAGNYWNISNDSSGGLTFNRNGTDLFYIGRSGNTAADFAGNLSVTGALSKGSGSFRIEHPLPEKSATHQLVHSFIEGPQADLIYRGKVVLVDGKASVNIDTAATMTEGTFEVLCRDVQCFTTNESGWTAVRAKVTGNILTIEAKDADCVDEISWMVIGERQDPHIMDTDWTDENGRPIVEPLKPAEPALESK